MYQTENEMHSLGEAVTQDKMLATSVMWEGLRPLPVVLFNAELAARMVIEMVQCKLLWVQCVNNTELLIEFSGEEDLEINRTPG